MLLEKGRDLVTISPLPQRPHLWATPNIALLTHIRNNGKFNLLQGV